jgi:hypothetical protein
VGFHAFDLGIKFIVLIKNLRKMRVVCLELGNEFAVF